MAYRSYYKPYGEVAFTSGSSRTDKGFTGQRLDVSSGLMYYGARYYDPVLSYFISPDTIVPGSAVSSGGGAATLGVDDKSKLTSLTTDFHETAFLGEAQKENLQNTEKGFWFQLSKDDKKKVREPWGPMNPQALNRYSYVLNNPLRYTDPSGYYNYTYSWNIYDDRRWPNYHVSAQDVMHELMSHPQQYFPFHITPTSGCSVMAEGCTYTLDPGVPGYQPYEVRVINVTPTSFTFIVTTSGGFATKGSTITFSTYEQNGTVYLQQHGVTEAASNPIEWVSQLAEQGGAFLTWQSMADNLREHFNYAAYWSGILGDSRP